MVPRSRELKRQRPRGDPGPAGVRYSFCLTQDPQSKLGQSINRKTTLSTWNSIMASASVGHVSPATSPRLPSPPPFPEVQLPPKSPGMPSASIPESTESSKSDNQPLRRIRPGTKAADMASGPPLIPLSEVNAPAYSSKDPHTYSRTSSTPPSNFKSTSNPSTRTIRAPLLLPQLRDP